MNLRPFAVAALAAVLAVLAGSARASTFAVVAPAAGGGLPSLTGSLPSAETPNLPGGIALPTPFTSPPANPQQLGYEQLAGIWQRAGAAYGIPWNVLAAINKIESNFGRNMGPSSAGAIGWMQFMPSTWLRWGTDANGDGIADPWNAEDAIYSAARYLAAAGGRDDLYRGVFAYNHADWYVREVLDLAETYSQGGEVAFSLDTLQAGLQEAQQRVVDANNQLVAQLELVRQLAEAEQPWRAREAQATLLSDRLAAGKQAGILAAKQQVAAVEAERLKGVLERAQQELAKARTESRPAGFAPGAGAVLQAPSYDGGYVFPVGGGPNVVSAAHDHHDYPAVDIAAPQGSPVYALADAVVLNAWHLPDARCGIGLTFQTDDGQVWTYCHLAYEEPGIRDGVRLTAGQLVGLVGSTGHATGPHLHLQHQPADAWPQQEPWFQSFAGRAFSWQDAPTPHIEAGEAAEAPVDHTAERSLASSSGGAPVFKVVPEQDAPADGAVVFFSR